jgi:hypothetical protein
MDAGERALLGEPAQQGLGGAAVLRGSKTHPGERPAPGLDLLEAARGAGFGEAGGGCGRTAGDGGGGVGVRGDAGGGDDPGDELGELRAEFGGVLEVHVLGPARAVVVRRRGLCRCPGAGGRSKTGPFDRST